MPPIRFAKSSERRADFPISLSRYLFIVRRPFRPAALRPLAAAVLHPLQHLPDFRVVQNAVAVAIDPVKIVLQPGRGLLLGELAVAVRISLLESDLEMPRG